ncbi:hypothetical protein [Roseateles sp. P5_E7]
MRFSQTLALLVFCMLSSQTNAHQDRILSLASDGSIPELPSQYTLTRLKMEFADKESGRPTKVTFISGGKQTVIERCVLQTLPADSWKTVSLSGSWYHERSTLPHYVSIRFKTPAQSPRLPAPVGISFLFSLEDARLLQIEATTATSNENEVQSRAIDLKGGCPLPGAARGSISKLN